MQALLRGKSIVVIGGTTGIGLSAALALVSAGARVVAVGLGAPGEATALRDADAHVIEADAREPQTAPQAIEEAVLRYGRFDGLYHVAGGSGRRFGDGPLHELTDEGWKETLDLNLTSLMLSNRAAVQQFLEQESGGSILNLSSVLAFSPSPEHFATHAYAAAKSAVIGFSTAIAAHYAPRNIRVNVIAPGLVETPMARRAAVDESIRDYIRKKQPLDSGRIGQPNDLDAAAVYFLSDGARFVTGQVLSVDGGWSVTT